MFQGVGLCLGDDAIAGVFVKHPTRFITTLGWRPEDGFRCDVC